MDSISPQEDAPSDLQLLQSFSQQHDQAAFTQLVLRHNGLVKRVCWRILGNEQDAEDAVQAVFMVLARRARLVAWQTSIANWLYGTAWRIAKRETRRKNKLPRQDHDMNEHPAEPSSLSETQVDEELLYPAIYSLPSRYRSAIVLCHLEGRSRKDAARELRISESALKGRLERAMEMLRRRLATDRSDSINQLASGALLPLIAQSALTNQHASAIANAAIGYGLGITKVGVSSLSVNLAQGESLAMLTSLQIKAATFAVVVLGTVGTWQVLAQTKGNSQTKSSGQSQQSAAKTPQTDQQKDALTKKNLQAIVSAVHAYIEDHQGMLPPAEVPNSDLPAEKRLSGFVLLLPYLGADSSGQKSSVNEFARAVYAKIDLSKAWDDPANAEAAKSIVPEFLSPLESNQVDNQGRALAHFAFVRGGLNRDNGIFPLQSDQTLAITEISDGTSATVAIGQLHDQPGPWIAAGSSTARFLNPLDDKSGPGFGSPKPGLAYFANGDAYTYCLDLRATQKKDLDALSGRDDGKTVEMGKLKQYPTISDAAKATKK